MRIEDRLKALEELAESNKAIDSEPFLLFEPFEILKDKYTISFHETGLNGAYTGLKGASLKEVIAFIKKHNADVLQISMGKCLEWLHVQYMNDDRYTNEQIKGFMQADYEKYPELALLYKPEQEAFYERLLIAPQQKIVYTSDFMTAINCK